MMTSIRGRAACLARIGRGSCVAIQRDAYTRFSISGVLLDTFEAIGRNFSVFAALAALAEIPNVAFHILSATVTTSATGLEISLAHVISLSGLGIVEALVAFASSCIAQGALSLGTVAELNGKRASLPDCLSASVKSLSSLLGISILATLGLLGGLLLLVVPGVVLALGWAVAVPVCVIERKSVFESFRRSWYLTSGHRLTIFGMVALAAVGLLIFLLIVLSLSSILANAAGGGAGPLILYIFQLIVEIATAVFSGSLMGAIYYELYVIKEGHAPGAQASVFD